MDSSIIIVNYNTTDHLIDCLKSIIDHTKGIKYQIIVVDNNSPERDIEKLTSIFPDIKFLFRNINDGFGGGCDYGASFCSGKYIAFINPDIVFNSDGLTSFYEFMENNPDVGLCAGLLINEKQEPIYSFNKFPDLHWEITEALLGNGKSKIDRLIKSKSKYIEDGIPFEIDWAIGANMFIRKEAFDKLGGFDKDLFLYSEDVDLQLRLRKIGYNIKCLPNVRLQHFTKSSISSVDGDNIYQMNLHKSKLIYMSKHFSFIKRIIVRLAYIIGITIRIIILPFRNKYTGKKGEKIQQLLTILKFYIIPISNLRYRIIR